MNVGSTYSANPLTVFGRIFYHRSLIKKLIAREFVARYKGSFLGLTWSFFSPLLLLSVYTFVFSFVFNARWSVGSEPMGADFALIIFVGLILHSFLADVLIRAPELALSNVNYVKKVVFPLEILVIVSLGTALIHLIVSVGVLAVVLVCLGNSPGFQILLLPLTLFPIILLALGLGWFLASIGVYLRDIGQFIGIVTTSLLFLAPVFYPVTALPVKYQAWIFFNPLTIPIEATRQIVLFGQYPNWYFLGVYTLISIVIALLGLFCFQKLKRGFADVL